MDIVFGSGKTLRGWQQAEDFELSLLSSNEAVGITGSSTPTIKDMTYDADTTAGTTIKSDIVINNQAGNPPVSLISETPAVCTIDALGRVSRVADGVCNILASGQTGKRRISQTINQTGVSTVYNSILGVEAGSLRKYLYDQQIAALAGVTPGATAQRAQTYSCNLAAGNGTTNNLGGGQGPVNTSNFLLRTGVAGFDGFPLDILESVLAATGQGAIAESRVWLTPHHYIDGLGAAHGTQPGATYRLVGADQIVRYSATPWGGTLAKLLPANYKQYLPDSLLTTTTNIACWARMFNTYIGSSTDPTAERRWVMPVNFVKKPFDSSDPRYAYQKQYSGTTMATGGDSGSPVFCGIHGELVIISHVTFYGGLGYDDFALLAPQINTAMNELATYYGDPAAGTYAVQTVDLSAFTSYP